MRSIRSFFQSRRKLSVQVDIINISISFLIFIMLLIVGMTVLTDYIVSQKSEATSTQYEYRIQELETNIEEYEQQIDNVISIRDEYRTHVKDLVELLYNRDVALGIGGASISEDQVEESDEVRLLQLRTTISTMEDDLKLMSEVKNYLSARREFANNFPFIWPVDRNGVPRVSSGYGFRENSEFEEYATGIHHHAGIDIPGEEGESIIATADGQVFYTTITHPIYGGLIIIHHEYGFRTYYAHVGEIHVSMKQNVKRGQTIASMGNTGKSQGVHLHYEIRKKDGSTPAVSLDPMTFLGMNY